MRIFVTGASGYIGNVVARTFRAKGHTVYGLVRSDNHAVALSLDEIWPVIGNLNNPDSYLPLLKEVEVVVHCALEPSENASELDGKTVDTILNALSNQTVSKAFIYTSGVWVYGSTAPKMVDEANAVNAIDLVTWRVEHEKKVLKATSPTLRTVVMRPGCVYGGVGGLTNLFFTSTQEGSVTVAGDGSNHWAMVHVVDLAHAYVAVVEKELSNVVLNVVDDSNFTVKEMAEAVAKSANMSNKINYLSKEESEKQFGHLTQGLMIDQLVSNARIKRLLGWQIHHLPFINEVDIYYNAWKAAQHEEVF